MHDNPDARTVCCIGGMTLDRTLRLLQPGVTGTSSPVASHRTRGGVARNVAENLARLSVFCTSDEARVMLGDDIAKDTKDMATALCRRGARSVVVTARVPRTVR
jgi:sugar/nucleoside kinase (ribokinase family)